MNNKVKIISQELIKPSSPTPPHLKTYKVSLLDQFSPSSYMPFIFFYDAAAIQNPVDRLKESFSKALSVYYPLAGRFRDVATIDCNDEGALFVEARVNYTLSEFFKNPDIQGLSEFLPCKGNGLVKSPTPHVAVKISQFECGGIVVGACLFHKVVDALSAAVFLNDWGKITRGEPIVEPNFTAASALFPPRDPLSQDFVRIFDNFFFQGTMSYMRRYTFDEVAVKAIRSKASTENLPNPSRLEALSAFVAERMAGAHSKLAADQSSFTTLMLTHPVNLRQRVDPPLPENTFGNVIWLAFGFYEIDPDSNGKIQLGELAEVLREAFSSLDKEAMAELDNDEAFGALNELLESVYTNEKIKIYRFTTAANMGLYEVNFGWGKPGWFGHMGDMVGYRSKQQFAFMEAAGGGRGLELWLAADEAEHGILEKDAEFLKYAVPNPAISG